MSGANVFGSCRASGHEEALALDVGVVVDYRALDIAPYRHRFDALFDTADALALSKCSAKLKRRGRSLYIVPTSACSRRDITWCSAIRPAMHGRHR